MEEDEFPTLKRGRRAASGRQAEESPSRAGYRDRGVLPESEVEAVTGGGSGSGEEYYGDYYVTDEDGRPVSLLKSTRARRSRASPAPSLKKYVGFAAVFAGLLAVTGQFVAAAIVAGSTLFVVVVAKLKG